MSGLVNVLAVMAPLLVAALMARRGRPRTVAIAIAPWLSLLLLPPLAASQIGVPIVLLHLRLGADAVAAPLIVLCAVAWSLAGWFATHRVDRDRLLFWTGWLLSLAGISLALLAQDVAGFYAGYALLSLASWLLIVHARSDEAWRAGRIYLVLALLGEMSAFAGLVAIVAAVGNVAVAEVATAAALAPHWHWLILAGFAVKMGVVPLHVWLPLAHPVAPVPASAVLSGVIVKAGLLGWLRLLPPGSAGAEALGPVLIALGVFTAFVAVAIGLAQTRPKVVLAYSTISQMGLVLAAYAALLMASEQAPVLLPWLGVIVLHHGLNKASLFLACGCAPARGWFGGLLVAIPALALAAAPLTTGMLAKTGLKTLLAGAGVDKFWALPLSLTSTATALLLWHFWVLVRGERGQMAVHPAWPVMTVAGLLLPWAWAIGQPLGQHMLPALWPSIWPLALAAVLVWAWRRAHRDAVVRLSSKVPPGDLVVWPERAARLVGTRLARVAHLGSVPLVNFYPIHVRITRLFLWLERKLTSLPVAGVLILGLGGALWLISRWS